VKALAIQAGVAKLEDIRRLFRETVARLSKLDIFIANAGYARFGPIEEVIDESRKTLIGLSGSTGREPSSAFKRRCAT